MTHEGFDRSDATARARASKRAANLSINSELLQQARALDINLSATLEQALQQAVRTRQAELWRRQNLHAIAAYNDAVEAQGVFSDGVRAF
ncbi:type II toxin-antitoxin system CcdA family antitoxin [Ottowia testudinis]|uniref:Type II toxin-antitoxin system CcdA family antitoxin n=1 Tax=Ottowia testudinis TaxID=2816950 RepID=A0A975CGD7_9BURK|nr:type II toxin-antitoxin system CcdA family antitoxin [Ottowia testudinis]QTD43664.1 type II toxin-antitoxin system CcdA family antitoxin [Ottowia testudinis]